MVHMFVVCVSVYMCVLNLIECVYVCVYCVFLCLCVSLSLIECEGTSAGVMNEK